MLYVIRYGEIGIKGKNRIDFERKLVENIKLFCKPAEVERIRGRILVKTENPQFKRIFGIVNYSPAISIKKEIGLIKETVLSVIKDEKTFRISARRLSKDFFMNSRQLAIELGSLVVNSKGLKVDLDNPELNIGVEILNKRVLIFTKRIKGLGGLPVGTAGNVVCRISSKADELACLLVMKRGGLPKIEVKNYEPKILPNYLINEAKDNIKAEVSGKILSELPEIKNETVLYPLIGYTKEQVEVEYESYN